MAPIKTTKGGKKKEKVTHKFVIDASQPVSDMILDVAELEKFLHDKIKVEGRIGNLGDVVKISQEGESKIVIVAHIQFSSRYLKWLTKKFLKKHRLRDWLRVVSSKRVLQITFYNVEEDDFTGFYDDDGEDEEE
ncbi:60S ribosomal protein L22 [Sphaerosporella brunnea]|uniref:60S ribosomal protein L22 n=1 Tax=Sphaerosporella brunnea TaxID=1250544 RepID=A0A5J5EZL1_9PEZI|nr:60S ribosomal protein L22 [Sphaerosporella brunnea]